MNPESPAFLRAKVLLGAFDYSESEFTNAELEETILYIRDHLLSRRGPKAPAYDSGELMTFSQFVFGHGVPSDSDYVSETYGPFMRVWADEVPLDMNAIHERALRWASCVTRLKLQLEMRAMHGDISQVVIDCQRRVYALYMFIKNSLLVMQSLDPTFENMGKFKDQDLVKFLPDCGTGGDAGAAPGAAGHKRDDRLTQLYLTVLKNAYERGLAQHNGIVYRQTKIKLADGRLINSMAWEPLTQPDGQLTRIEHLIQNSLPREMFPNEWATMLSHRVSTLCAQLERLDETEFPKLVFKRGFYSFRNGILDIRKPYFYLWDDPTRPTGVTSLKYFDLDFDLENTMGREAYRDTPTPNLHKILLDQLIDEVKVTITEDELLAEGIDVGDREAVDDYADRRKAELIEEILDWSDAFIGRTMFELGELDNWQVAFVGVGMGNSGKSTISDHVVQNFYRPEQVKALSIKGDEYSPASLSQGLLWVTSELSKIATIPEPTLLEMLSGGKAVPIRHFGAQGKGWETIHWKIPAFLMGNVMPQFNDAQGQFSRRLVVFSFNKSILKGDAMLPKKLEAEMGNIIWKCASAYLDKVDQYGKYLLWQQIPVTMEDGSVARDKDGNAVEEYILPEYFRRQRLVVQRASNHLALYLAETAELVFAPHPALLVERCRKDRTEVAKTTFAMPFKVFKEKANAFIREMNAKFEWVDANIRRVFTEFQIERFLYPETPGAVPMYMGAAYPGEWVVGVTERSRILHAAATEDAEASTGGTGAMRDDEDDMDWDMVNA